MFPVEPAQIVFLLLLFFWGVKEVSEAPDARPALEKIPPVSEDKSSRGASPLSAGLRARSSAGVRLTAAPVISPSW